MLLHARRGGHRDELQRALPGDHDVRPPEDVQRRRRVRRREERVAEGIAQPEAGDGEAEFAVRPGGASARRCCAVMGAAVKLCIIQIQHYFTLYPEPSFVRVCFSVRGVRHIV